MARSRTWNPRPHEPPMPEPLAFFLTWTSYGTWLPGDERGWVAWGKGFQLPDPKLKAEAAARMVEDACTLDPDQRRVVEKTIRDHCQIRKWELHAVNCRTKHVHVVVSANRDPKEVRDQLKAWCTRKLKELERSRGVPADSMREHWWTEGGSQRVINDEESLEAAIRYVLEGQ